MTAEIKITSISKIIKIIKKLKNCRLNKEKSWKKAKNPLSSGASFCPDLYQYECPPARRIRTILKAKPIKKTTKILKIYQTTWRIKIFSTINTLW